MKTCPTCLNKKLYFKEDMHCPVCGAVLEHTHLDKCKKCGEVIAQMDAKFCTHCGADLNVG